MIQKKDWFSDIEILKIYEQVSREKYEQKPLNRFETQNTKNQNTTDPKSTIIMLTQKDRINLELIKKIMIENKIALTSLRNQDWKKPWVETEKLMKLLPNILIGNINKLNELIYAVAKLVCDKIGVPQGNSNKNTKPGWEKRLEGQIKKLRQQAKVLRREKFSRIFWEEETKTKTGDKSKSRTGKDKSKDIVEKRETQKIPGKD